MRRKKGHLTKEKLTPKQSHRRWYEKHGRKDRGRSNMIYDKDEAQGWFYLFDVLIRIWRINPNLKIMQRTMDLITRYIRKEKLKKR